MGARVKDQQRTVTSLAQPLKGGVLTFANQAQETPIQEIWAYNVTAGAEPKDAFKMSYTVRADVAPDYLNLADLNAYIAGRHPAGERATVVAIPEGAPSRPRPAGDLAAPGARGRRHAQHQRRLVSQEVAAGRRDRQAAMAGKVDVDQAQRDHLAQDRPPCAAVVFGADTKGGDTVVAGPGDALVLDAEQYVYDIGLPEAFAGTIDA